MPVACVVQHKSSEKKFFACHGGLTPQLICEDPAGTINSTARRKYGQQRLSEFMPSEAPSSPLVGHQPGLIEGLLWSDPHEFAAEWLPSERGAGRQWGAAATTAFCDKGAFELVVRAHQMTDEGFSWHHGKKVLTVFSAADYCGCANDGAVLLVHTYWTREIETYKPPPPDALRAAAASAPPQPLLPYFRQDDDNTHDANAPANGVFAESAPNTHPPL